MRFYTSVEQSGSNLLVRGVEDGERFSRHIKYRPYAFVQSPKGTYRSLDGLPLARVDFDSMWDLREFRKNRKDVYGYDRVHYVWIHDEFPDDIEYDTKHIRIGYIDIETAGISSPQDADEAITAITYKVNGTLLVFGLGDFVSDREDVIYFKCRDELDLLRKFLLAYNDDQYSPDILTGWNIEGFDIPYLVNRIRKVWGDAYAKKLSPWRRLRKKTIVSFGKNVEVEVPVGVAILDYLLLYKKLAVGPGVVDTPDDYKLNTVAHNEVGESKIDYSQEYDNLFDLYARNHQLFMEYNIRDTELVEKMEHKRRLIDLVIAMTYSARANYEDILGTVRQWECIIHHELMKEGVALPPRRNNAKDELIGGYVKNPPPRLYEWVVSCDLNSLYSHLQMQWNISPETRRGQVKKLELDEILDGGFNAYRKQLLDEDVIVSGNSCLYTREFTGIVPKILKRMYDTRVIAKGKMLDCQKLYEETKDPAVLTEIAKWKNMQQVMKTNLNGCYGCFTNIHFILYDFLNAEAITTSGRLAITWIERKLNAYFNKLMKTKDHDYVVAMDTDSVYLEMKTVVDRYCEGMTEIEIVNFLDAMFEEKIEHIIESGYEELQAYVNAVEQKMKMKREKICSRAIWVGKKNYILNVWDSEKVRYKEPKIDMKGIQAIKSSTPSGCRTKLQEGIKLILSGTETDVIKFVDDFYEEFMTLPFTEIAFPRSINGMSKYASDMTIYTKGTPVQVKGSLLYNDMLDRFNMKQYPRIYDGDKVKYAYLKMPNLVRDKVIATPGPIPPSFRLEEVIDKNLMFQIGFQAPLQKILTAMGWKAEAEGNVFE